MGQSHGLHIAEWLRATQMRTLVRLSSPNDCPTSYGIPMVCSCSRSFTLTYARKHPRNAKCKVPALVSCPQRGGRLHARQQAAVGRAVALAGSAEPVELVAASGSSDGSQVAGEAGEDSDFVSCPGADE